MRYFTWKLELVSDILWMIVEKCLLLVFSISWHDMKLSLTLSTLAWQTKLTSDTIILPQNVSLFINYTLDGWPKWWCYLSSTFVKGYQWSIPSSYHMWKLKFKGRMYTYFLYLISTIHLHLCWKAQRTKG